MKRRLTLVFASLVVLAPVMMPRAAEAQVDPATQRLIDDLGFRNQNRGMAGPRSPDIGGTPVSAPAPRIREPSPSPRRVRETTAPEGIPAVSIRVEFASGSTSLTPGAMSQLDRLGAALVSEELAQDRFRIEGHTDTVGPSEQNLRLSERRAIAVRDYLIGRFSIPQDRLVAEGKGETTLLVPTPDETANLQNRRVQVLNLGN